MIGPSMSELKDWLMSSFTRHASIGNDISEIQEVVTNKEFIEAEQVRIYPGRLEFNGAYDGKKFLEKFRIINFGKVPAFVRVMQPTSEAFRMKPLPKGCILSSGLSITRYIQYTYFSATAIPQVYITVYINEKPILYELIVNISQSIVKTCPKMLHFGDINIGTASDQLSLHLRNEGQKITHFSVDLGRNDLELIVDPMKGAIQPYETVEIKVEILGSREGKFLKEFWIKTEPPQRIWLTGTFILPRLKIVHPPSSFDLIVIDFPRTYYNADSVRALVIKNNSSTNTMFCTMANYKNEEKKLEEARKFDHNLNFFLFNPKEGRLTKKHKAVIIVTFAPRRLRTFTQKYCIAMIKIIKVNYRDGVIKGKDMEVKTFSSNLEADQFQIGSACSVEEVFSEFEFTSSYLRICLYGEIEEPDVRLTPHSIDREELNVGRLYNFTFNIKNCSKYLPITFKYEKLACFEIIPPEMTLKPNCSVDVLLLLKPSTIGQIDTNINLRLTYKAYGIVYKVGNARFHVRYVCHKHPDNVSPMTKPRFNMGITPAITNEVGFLVDDIRFNQAKSAPIVPFVDNVKRMGFDVENRNLIAFPNDRSRSLRPWTSKDPCMTIFTNIPRIVTTVDEYTLTSAEIDKKMKNNQTYMDLLRKNRKPVKDYESGWNPSSCYPTSMKKVLMTNEPTRDCPYIFKGTEKHPGIIPLTPEQLMAVEISPHYIQLGKIAPYISCSDFFTIENKNEFPIRIDIVALSNSVVVKGKKITTIGAFATAELYFDCYSHGLGKYYVPVYIIINNCHIFDATVFAEVVPTTVKCKTKEVTTNPKDDVAYLELFNPVNCAIDFSWVLLDKNYSIMPSSGTIESRRSLYCKIVFSPRIDAVFKTDIFLYSQSGAKQVIALNTENNKAPVLFNTRVVEFSDIPLNMRVSENLVFKNNSVSTIVLYIKNENPIAEITVSPKEAVVPGRSVIFFKVFAHFRTVEKFKCECSFVVQDAFVHKIEIIGKVNYPTFSIEPNYIQIPKIVTGACQRKVFRIKNTNTAKISIKFVLDLYTDYKVLDMEKHKIEEINLNPYDAVNLYLEFQPPEPTAYTFYVPMVINGLVGPPLLNNPKSFEYTTYFDRPPMQDEETRKIVGLRVACAAGTSWFRFSSLELNFNNDTLKNNLHITNISTVQRHLRLFIDNLNYCFNVEVEDFLGVFKIKENYIKVILEPEENVIFTFNFSKDCYGIYEAEVPIFVTDYFENCPFNFVKLYAKVTKPTIESKIKMVCLPTIPLKSLCTCIVPFHVHSHRPNCKITVISEHEFLKAERIKVKGKVGSNQDIRITFLPKMQCNVVSKITISCSCEALCEISVIGSANNCSLLSFRHRMKWYSDQTKDLTSEKKSVDNYNFDQNNVLFGQKLDRLKNILEQYIHTQGFFTSMFYSIPETIRKYPFEVYEKKQTARTVTKEKKKHLPIVILFKNLADSRIIKNFVDGVHFAVLDDVEGTLYDYGIYKNILLYMEEYGMFSKNIKPEHLLTYKKYLILKDQFVDNENIIDDVILSEVDYNFICKQSWLDLLLRIYKMLTYDRLLLKAGKLVIQDPFAEKSREYYLANRDSFGTDIGEGEIKLMLWLEYHFNYRKDRLWPDKKVPNREIRDLCSDVRDSLPLITLTATYCPYLEEYFRETYFEPFTDPGQLLHNACLVSEAWNKLELSYTISTNNIVEPTNTEMIIFLSYLYSVLPYFYPTEAVTVKSELGETSSVHVLLTNDTLVTSSFKAILFLNDSESFSLEPNEVTVEPKQKKNIRVFYKAKQIIKEEAVLVLSGEFGTEKYSKSSAINLVGIPDILHFVDEFTLGVNMYEFSQKNIIIQSPYKQSYSSNTYYYIYDADKPPLTMKDFVSVNAVPNLPRQFRIDGVCNFKENGSLKLGISLCFITCGVSIYYVYFVNKEIGVFCIKLTIESKLPEGAFEEVRIRIPSNFDTLSVCKCKSGINPLCPRAFKAAIPFRNAHLLNGLRKMISIHANSDEQEFWNLHLVFPKGFHIFREYVKNTYEPVLLPFNSVLDPEVVYTPKVEGSNYSTEGRFKIKDTTDEGTFPLSVHWDASSFPQKEALVLRAEHRLEVRKFHLTFWTREPRAVI